MSNSLLNTNVNTNPAMRLRTKKRERRIVIAGDSILGGIKQNKMRDSVSRNDKLFLKSFSGSTIGDMHHYIEPSLKHSPPLIALHIGTNDLRSSKNATVIADELLSLAKYIKSSDNVVMISGIIVRRDIFNEKPI